MRKIKQRERERRSSSNWSTRDFQLLIDFVNQEIKPESWKNQLDEAMGDERFCNVTYTISKRDKTKKMHQGDIFSNLSEVLCPGNDFEECRVRIDHAIKKIDPCLPKIGGKEAAWDSTQKLRMKLKGILTEMAKTDLVKFKEKSRLMKKIEAAYRFELQREAIMFPDGTIYFKSWMSGDVNADEKLYFSAARLLEKIHQTFLFEDRMKLSPSENPRLKLFKKPFILGIHPLYNFSLEVPEYPIGLSCCMCGCGNLFIVTGGKEKKFLNDQHRLDFHNRKRTQNGDNRKAVAAWREKNPEHKLRRKN